MKIIPNTEYLYLKRFDVWFRKIKNQIQLLIQVCMVWWMEVLIFFLLYCWMERMHLFRGCFPSRFTGFGLTPSKKNNRTKIGVNTESKPGHKTNNVFRLWLNQPPTLTRSNKKSKPHLHCKNTLCRAWNSFFESNPVAMVGLPSPSPRLPPPPLDRCCFVWRDEGPVLVPEEQRSVTRQSTHTTGQQ